MINQPHLCTNNTLYNIRGLYDKYMASNQEGSVNIKKKFFCKCNIATLKGLLKWGQTNVSDQEL